MWGGRWKFEFRRVLGLAIAVGAKMTSIYVHTPTLDGTVHHTYVAGLLSCFQAGADPRYAMAVNIRAGSLLPRNRDVLTHNFLRSGATHMLCVDADVGFTHGDVVKLVESGKWFVSGCYPKKRPDREVPAKLLDAPPEGELRRAEFVPGGFLLVRREAVLAMTDHWGNRSGYETTDGTFLPGLWQPVGGGGEDIAFCNRWRQMGGEVWLHTGVRLNHTGAQTWTLRDDEELRFQS